MLFIIKVDVFEQQTSVITFSIKRSKLFSFFYSLNVIAIVLTPQVLI